MNSDLIRSSVLKLREYIEAEDYRGYDPYDALKSPLFKLPVLKSNNTVRFLSQQFVKRFPLNLRPLLGIKKGYNPVTLGLCIQGYSNCTRIFPGHKNEYSEKINRLIEELEKLIPSGYNGACWGYDFDWQSRYAKIPAYHPTVVATGFVTNALFNYYRVSGNKKALELCVSSTKFILNDLNRMYDDRKENFCFSYSPFDHEVVFNATMKAARALAQVYSETHDENLKNEAKKTVAFVMSHQKENGSWIYSKSAAGKWIDNYHTGYVIDCLDEYIRCTGDTAYSGNLLRGFDFYREHFIHNNSIPKFYDNEIYPVDCTAAAQTLLTLSRFGEAQTAGNIAEWMINNMQSKEGYFYFRKFRNNTMKASFMRWSNAWMFLGLTELLAKESK